MDRHAHIVIGAGFGDEGKGLVTDYLTHRHGAGVVCRFNGGAQAGHTVQTPTGIRHVFHHLGSGSLLKGRWPGRPEIPGPLTFLGRHFVANPLLLEQELAELRTKVPREFAVFCDRRALLTTPYDMLINQAVERHRGADAHGSCGVGINETVTRCQHRKYRLTVGMKNNHDELTTRAWLIKTEYVYRRLEELGVPLTKELDDMFKSESLFDDFCKSAVRFGWKQGQDDFLDDCSPKKPFLRETHVVFEGAQGLMLDQDFGMMPHVTRSNTGLKNVEDIAFDFQVQSPWNVYYVTRCYATRHGNGPLKHQLPGPPHRAQDSTNVPHEFQGTLRYGILDLDELARFINLDVRQKNWTPAPKLHLVVTCLDQLDDVHVFHEGRRHALPNKLAARQIGEMLGFPAVLESRGPTREHVKEVYNEHVSEYNVV